MKTARIRFYEELNDFLPSQKRKRRYEINFTGTPSIKDVIESQGVPHTEVDLILVHGKSVRFDYKLKSEDDVSVYPLFESFDISSLQRLRAKPLRKSKFVLDVHLGTLAKYMRMFGFDTKYQNDFSDEKIIEIFLHEKRTVLTRDVGILKRKEVTHGYFVRNIKPIKQIEEIIKRFDLQKEIKGFSRCIRCNTKIVPIEKEKIIDKIPPKVKSIHSRFFYCKVCKKVYWKGSHYDKMKVLIEKMKASQYRV
ncbi:MAG: Mut7-C RNAse domain-containing protein [Bacteroidota bacterium]